MRSIQAKPAAPSPVHYIKNSSPVTSLGFLQHNDSLVLIQGNSRGHVSLTDMESCETLCEWRAHSAGCQSIVLFDHPSRLLTQGRGEDLRVWDVESKQLLHAINISHAGFCRAIMLDCQRVLCATDNTGELAVVAITSATTLSCNDRSISTRIESRLSPPSSCGSVMQMALIPTSAFGRGDAVSYVLVVYESAMLALWRIDGCSGRIISRIQLEVAEGHTPLCVTIAPVAGDFRAREHHVEDVEEAGPKSQCSQDGMIVGGDTNEEYLAVIGTSSRHLLRALLSVSRGLIRQIDSLFSPSAGQASVCVRPSDHRLMVVGCWDGCVRVYGWGGRQRQLACLRHHTASAEHVMYAPGPVKLWSANQLLVSASSDKTTAFWKIYDKSK